MSLNQVNYLICFIALFFLHTLCFALPEDKTKVMHLQANRAELNQSTHSGTYVGEVTFDQGSTHIRAAKAVTEGNTKNQLIKAIIEGNQKTQAHYWALTDNNKPPIHAYADIIRYYPERHLIELIGNARVQQGDNSFSAPKISYDTLHHHVISAPSQTMRTTIIIQPDSHP